MLVLFAALLATVSADFKPCGPTSSKCCDPKSSPPEVCPGGIKCSSCGGADSCECPPAPPPTPPPPPKPVSKKRLTFVNGCHAHPIWISHVVGGGIGPDPQDVKIKPGGRFRFTTAVGGGGLSATRFWPKMGCDATGNNCTIGDSGGPGEGCVIHGPSGDDYSKCAPPVDSKFEGTFEAAGSALKDTVDMSLVDGFSLPFKLEVTGGTCIRNGTADSGLIDCSRLTHSQCPKADVMNGKALDLRATNPKTGELAGCYSPCMRLTDNKWHSAPVAPDSEKAAPYCCAGTYGTPGVCMPGPITKTDYVANVHSSCKKGYAYAYDDKRATLACSTDSKYTVTFYCMHADEPQQVMV